jgi:hypothetical protein
MALFFVASSWGQSVAGPDTAKQTDKGTTAVKPEQAEENLIKKVAPIYPPLAKQVRIQGKVKVQVVISKAGCPGFWFLKPGLFVWADWMTLSAPQSE